MYTSYWFSFELDLKAYPAWGDLIDNVVHLKTTDLTMCDKLTYGYKVGYFNLYTKFGFRNCYSGIYDYLYAETPVTHTCAMQYTTIKNLIDKTLGPQGSSVLLLDTCTVKPVEPEPVEPAEPEVPVTPAFV